jgi:maltose alpha-D-glucosyltransferase/alpha-amylase
MSRSDRDRLADQMRTHAEASLGLLQERLGSLDDASRRLAETVLAAHEALVSRFDRIRSVARAGLRIRVHGDYHLGQVLRTDEDFVIIDFGGDPARSLPDRRVKQSPLTDVAGMVRSFGYAAYAALSAFTVHTPDEYAALESWADAWQWWAATAFLGAYRPEIASAPGMTDPAIVPPGDEGFGAMLTAFVVDKAFDELTCELNGRPDWVRVPLTGLLRLASG